MENSYKVYWKGSLVGVYTLADIKLEMRFGRIGLYHNIQISEGETLSVKDFLARYDTVQQPVSAQANHVAAQTHSNRHLNVFEQNLEFIAYGACGLCFLHPLFLLLLLPIVIYIYTKGKMLIAAKTFVIGAVIAFLGYAFFNLILTDMI